MRIRTRFAVAGTICTSVIAVGVGGLLMRETTGDLRQAFDRQLSARVEAVSPLVSTAPDTDRLVDVLSANAQSVGIRVLQPGKPEVRVGDVPARPPAIVVANSASSSALVTVRQSGRNWRAVQEIVMPSSISDASGPITVQVFGPLADLEYRIAELRRRVIRIAGSSVALAGFTSWIMGSYVALPMRRLSTATEGLEDLPSPERRVPDDQGVVEVDELGATLNHLLERLRQEHAQTIEALELARAFSWNAVHELRTPLMSLRTDLDVLVHRPDLDDSEREKIVTGMIAQHERTARLLTALHDLARTDLQSKSLFADVDLAEVAEAACDAAGARHLDADVQLVSPDHAWMRGWGEGLRLLVDNLIDNAIKHGGRDKQASQVIVLVDSEGSGLRLVVDDRGPGISPADRERIFDRFARGSSAAPGLGLGLALVRQQALLHEAIIDVEQSPLGGARFAVTFQRVPVHSDAFR